MPVCHTCNTCTNVMVVPCEENYRKHTPRGAHTAAPHPHDRMAAR
jgi:hypothetical protein